LLFPLVQVGELDLAFRLESPKAREIDYPFLDFAGLPAFVPYPVLQIA
jgi:hypothetical protein